MNKKTVKIIVGLIMIIAVSSAIFATLYTAGYKPFEHISLSKVEWIKQPTLSGGEYIGGTWLASGVTTYAKYEMVDMSVDNIGLSNNGALTSTMVAQSSLVVEIKQTQNPYYELPFTYIDTYTITPNAYGTHVGASGLQSKDQRDVAKINELKVTIYRADPTNIHLFIPIQVSAFKLEGISKTQVPLATDCTYAQLADPDIPGVYNIVISEEVFTGKDVHDYPTRTITFYNPANKDKETFDINLLFQVGGGFQWANTMLGAFYVVSEYGGNAVGNTNSFLETYDANDFSAYLDYNSQNPWSFYNYWFGDFKELPTTVFKGTSYVYIDPLTGYAARQGVLSRWDDNTPCAEVYWTGLLGLSEDGILAEGYRDHSATIENWHEYPGWYTPSPTNTEGAKVTDEWWNKRYPIRPAVVSLNVVTDPLGLSVCDYLAATQLTTNDGHSPVTHLDKGDAREVLARVASLDPIGWGAGYVANLKAGYNSADDCGTFKLNIPKAARSWFYTLTVSTDIVDLVYLVQEGYPQVEIVSGGSALVASIPSGSTVEVKAKIRNKSVDIEGFAQYMIIIPTELFGIVTTGGSDMVWLTHLGTTGDSKDVTVTLTNHGQLIEENTYTFKFSVGNRRAETAFKQFSLKILPGEDGGGDTILDIYVKEVDTNAIVSGVNVEVFYGSTFNLRDLKQTDASGWSEFSLNTWVGSVSVTVTDPSGRYETKTEPTFSVARGSQSHTIYVMKVGVEYVDWQQYLPYIVAGVIGLSSVGGLGYYYTKKKQAGGAW